MKLIVLYESGETETLTLIEPCGYVEGPHLNRLRSGRVEHFFTKEGHYDGWGQPLNDECPEADC